MRLPTYTSIWELDRKLYKVEDWVLPVPVSLLQAGVFAGVAAVWWLVLRLLGVVFSADTGWLYLVPPGAAAWLAGRPVAEHKRIHQLLGSQLRYLLQPRALTRLTEQRAHTVVRAHATVWTRHRQHLPALSAVAPPTCPATTTGGSTMPSRPYIQPDDAASPPVAADGNGHSPTHVDVPRDQDHAEAARPVVPFSRPTIEQQADAAMTRWSTAAEFTDETMLRPTKQPPKDGWRRGVYRASFGLVNPGPSPQEQAERDLIARVKAPIHGSRRIVVLSRKGGVGKTTTTLMLGHTFAAHRGDRVVAVDGNPDAGSLAYRVRRETSLTVTNILSDQERITRYADIRGYTSQAPTRLEVVASDDDPHITQALQDHDYRQIVDVLDHHYNLVLLDTGTGILDSGIQGILREADQLVVVMPPAIDGARVASATLDWLDRHGYGRLVTSSVAVLNGMRDAKSHVEVNRVEEHFAGRTAGCVRIPWDPHLEAGAAIRYEQLRPATRDAYLQLAAGVADGFAAATPRRSASQ